MTTQSRKFRYFSRFRSPELEEHIPEKYRRVSTVLEFNGKTYCVENTPREVPLELRPRYVEASERSLARLAFIDLMAYTQELERQNEQLRMFMDRMLKEDER